MLSSFGDMQRFQSKTLRMITDAFWYTNSEIIQIILGSPGLMTLSKTILNRYRDRISNPPNFLVADLINDNITKRLKLANFCYNVNNKYHGVSLERHVSQGISC